MGRSSKELKEVMERAPEWPKEGKDYYLVRVSAGKWAEAGWVYSAGLKRYITRSHITGLLDKEKRLGIKIKQPRHYALYSAWYVYLGPRPDKKWGPVCP